LKGGELRVTKKLLDFNAKISDVKQINPLFSTCKVRVLYTGKNRNMSTITKDAVDKALPTLTGIPIVGEYSVENKDFKGHGGAIDMSDYRYIHTTKPYGFVPESATYDWVSVKGKDGATRDYLEVDGCVLWTGRYEEAVSVIENGKSQSMEIEVTDGKWDEKSESYMINNFTFSALCILGDDVEPAFEDANITAYSLNKDSFKQELAQMFSEFKDSLKQEKEVNSMLKELLIKYSITMEELTAKGLVFEEISEEDLEAKIQEVLEIQPEVDPIVDPVVDPELDPEQQLDQEVNPIVDPVDPQVDPAQVDPVDPIVDPVVDPQEPQVDVDALQARIVELEGDVETKDATISAQDVELNSLRAFKLNVEKVEHESKVQALFSNFQLKEEDVEGIDIHAFSLEEIEEKAYAILGRKMAKKNFSKEDKGNVRLPLNNEPKDETPEDKEPYGGLFKKYNK
jgi:hypothetical protein